LSAFLISWQLQYKADGGETGQIQKEEDKKVKEKGLWKKTKVREKEIGVNEEDKTQRKGNKGGE